MWATRYVGHHWQPRGGLWVFVPPLESFWTCIRLLSEALEAGLDEKYVAERRGAAGFYWRAVEAGRAASG